MHSIRVLKVVMDINVTRKDGPSRHVQHLSSGWYPNGTNGSDSKDPVVPHDEVALRYDLMSSHSDQPGITEDERSRWNIHWYHQWHVHAHECRPPIDWHVADEQRPALNEKHSTPIP